MFHALITAAAFVSVVFFRVHTVWIITAGLVMGLSVYLYELCKMRRKTPVSGNDEEKIK